LQHHVAKLPWTTITTIMDKIKDEEERLWYAEKTLENLWSRTVLEHQIGTNLYNRQALLDNKISNYKETLPTELGKRALEMLKDPYIFDIQGYGKDALEKDVEYFMTNEAFNQVDANEFILENYYHEMTAEERQSLPDSAFGLPKDRKYPLHDEEHVKLAIRFFNHTTGDDREELAKNIKKAAKKFGMQISVGKKNKLKDYLEEGSYILEKSKPTSDDSDKEEAETLYNDFINNEQIKPEYANSDKDGIDSVYLHDTFWPILSKFIDKNKDNEYLLTYTKKKLSRFKDKDSTPERYQKKAALMTFVEKEIKKIDEYLSKIEPDVDEEEDFEENALLEAVDNSLYFLSETNMDQKILQPRIPDNFLTKNGYEDNTTPRVCFSTSIDKCLTAMSMRLTNKEFYVHYPAEEHDVYSPSVEEVPDVQITGEKWIKEPVKLICVGKIRVTGPTRGKGMDYTYGDGKKATLYRWSWEKLESYLENTLNESTTINEEFISLGLNFDCNEVTPTNYNFYKKFYPDEKIRMDQSIENYVWTDPKNDHAFVARAGISHEGDEHWIFGIFIDPNYRGHGLCKQMLAILYFML